jgi:ATP:ADP antiporter, AAA family
MTSATHTAGAEHRKSPLDRLLGLAADVHAGEGGTALLLAVNGFLLLAAYYAIRPLRSALLLLEDVRLPTGTVIEGPQITSYLGAVLAALFLVIVPLYGALASRVTRIRLLNSVTTFFIATLLLFFVVVSTRVYPIAMGMLYFVWIGVFSLMVIAQFWSFANDLYSPEQGKRLFAIVGFGGTVGAASGALMARLASQWGPRMMIMAAVLLAASLLLTNIIHKRDRRATKANRTSKDAASDQSIGGPGGFQLVLSQPYLLAIGLVTLIGNLVNTNGNFILNTTVRELAAAAAQSGGGETARQVVFAQMAGVDLWQNLLVMGIQFFLVSRIFKYLGVGRALFILPLISLGSYSLFALAPVLSMIRIAKVTENATDYSLQNTVRRALFLPTSREAKYKALQAVETFFWRAGDLMSSLAVLVFVQFLHVSVRMFAGVNIAAVAVWLVLAAYLSRANRRMTGEAERVAA